MHESPEKTVSIDRNLIPSRKRSFADSFLGRFGHDLYDRFGDRRHLKFHRWALVVGTSLTMAFIMAPRSLSIDDMTVGEPAGETVISPITFKVVDQAATNKNRDEVLRSVRPVYDFDDEMVLNVESRIRDAFNFMRTYLAKEAEYQVQGPKKPREKPAAPKATGQVQEPFALLDEKSLIVRFDNVLGAAVSPATFNALKSTGFDTRIQRDLNSLVVPILLKGVVQSRELVEREGKKGILLWMKSRDKLEPLNDLSTIFDLKEAANFINAEDKESLRNPEVASAIRRVAKDLIEVNIIFNRDRSAAVKKEALESVKDVSFQVNTGEPIIKEGEPVTEAHLRKLEGLRKANPPHGRYVILVGCMLCFVILLRLSFYFAEKHLQLARENNRDLALFCLLMVGTAILVRVNLCLSPSLSPAGEAMNTRSLLYAAPVATGSMLMALLVEIRVAFLFAALAALSSTFVAEGDAHLFAFYFISGIVGLHGMSGSSDRTSILRAGLVVGLVNMLSIIAIKMALGHFTKWEEIYFIGLGFLGGLFSAMLVMVLSPLLEPMGYVTNVRLLEIANLNHPALKKMAMEAPGTYHHSMMVGHLAESAAEQIGANPLLARVGAYFHDIGKVGKKTKPIYFMENQVPGMNPHDKLEPSMSALIIQSHVKHGVEKAREFRLGQAISDIIQQHHGTNLIRIFYNKALEKAGKNPQSVTEDKYRYPGPRPRTKEAALVMLADVVEAACRALHHPTPHAIQKRVETLVMAQFVEGQLDESTLTLKDLHAITRAFVRALQGILHTRMEYPNTQSTEKTNGNQLRQQTDKDRHRLGPLQEPGRSSIRRLGL
ncbi:MAG: HDIG domain-containing metalloprotein [Thermodesulfobacteriota bacterium]